MYFFASSVIPFSGAHFFRPLFTNTLGQIRHHKQPVPWLRQLAAGLEPHKYWLNPRPVRAGFMVKKLALARDFLRVLLLSTVRFTTP